MCIQQSRWCYNDTSSEMAHVSLEPYDVNTTTTTTPLEPSGEISALTTTQASVRTAIDNQHTSPVRTTTIENHAQASSTVTVSTPNSFSCILVYHTPKSMRDTTAKRSISKS